MEGSAFSGEPIIVSFESLSGSRRELERSNQATLCKFYLETILTLRTGIAEGGFCCPTKLFLVSSLSVQGFLGLHGAPRFGANAAQSDANACDFTLLDIGDNRR
jgi:hypothetical protein